MSNYNEKLAEFVTNSNEVDRLVEFKGRLYQKVDPVYVEPESPMIKAHFYAPSKKLFNIDLPTLWINVIVMWIFSIGTYFVLYFRLVKLFFDGVEQFVGRFIKSSD